jgi:hypothetical protein
MRAGTVSMIGVSGSTSNANASVTARPVSLQLAPDRCGRTATTLRRYWHGCGMRASNVAALAHGSWCGDRSHRRWSRGCAWQYATTNSISFTFCSLTHKGELSIVTSGLLARSTPASTVGSRAPSTTRSVSADIRGVAGCPSVENQENDMQPIFNTPLGKPRKKTREVEPLTVPDTTPAPAPQEPIKEPVPAGHLTVG